MADPEKVTAALKAWTAATDAANAQYDGVCADAARTLDQAATTRDQAIERARQECQDILDAHSPDGITITVGLAGAVTADA